MTERINESLTLTFPDGFSRMSADEKRGMTTRRKRPVRNERLSSATFGKE